MHPARDVLSAVIQLLSGLGVEGVKNGRLRAAQTSFHLASLVHVLSSRQREDNSVGDHDRIGDLEVGGYPGRIEQRLSGPTVRRELERHDAAILDGPVGKRELWG